MTKYNTFKEIILKDISLEMFRERMTEDCSIEVDGETLVFRWENFSEQTLEFIDKNNNQYNRTVFCIDAIISSQKGDFIYTRPVKTILIEKNNNLVLILRGNSEIQTKIKSKLLGQHTNNENIKGLWEGVEINLPQVTFSVNFLLWLINLYVSQEIFEVENIQCRIADITYISDEGIYLSGIRKKGRGNRLINDPIIKATIATIETIDAIGLKLNFGFGMVNFILHNNGEIEINDESYINLPIRFDYNSQFGLERMVFFIKEIIIENLKTLYRDFDENEDYFKNIKSQFLLNTINEFGEILHINTSDERNGDTNIREIIIK